MDKQPVGIFGTKWAFPKAKTALNNHHPSAGNTWGWECLRFPCAAMMGSFQQPAELSLLLWRLLLGRAGESSRFTSKWDEYNSQWDWIIFRCCYHWVFLGQCLMLLDGIINLLWPIPISLFHPCSPKPCTELPLVMSEPQICLFSNFILASLSCQIFCTLLIKNIVSSIWAVWVIIYIFLSEAVCLRRKIPSVFKEAPWRLLKLRHSIALKYKNPIKVCFVLK